MSSRGAVALRNSDNPARGGAIGSLLPYAQLLTPSRRMTQHLINTILCAYYVTQAFRLGQGVKGYATALLTSA